jgi:hypothetical protein
VLKELASKENYPDKNPSIPTGYEVISARPDEQEKVSSKV